MANSASVLLTKVFTRTNPVIVTLLLKLPNAFAISRGQGRSVKRKISAPMKGEQRRHEAEHELGLRHILAGDYVGFDEVDDGIWAVYFGPMLLGRSEVARKVLFL